jgi:hypothetical protein
MRARNTPLKSQKDDFNFDFIDKEHKLIKDNDKI